MRAKCAIYGCKNATYNRLGYLLTFHRFPKNPARSLVWKKLCKNPKVMKQKYTSLYICSHHFDKQSFVNQSLKSNAVPNINLPKEGVGLFSMLYAEENATESNSGSEKDENVTTEEPEEEFCDEGDKEPSTVISSEGDESDSSKLLEASDDDSNASSSKTQNATSGPSATTGTTSPAPEPQIFSVSSLVQPSTSRAGQKLDDNDDSYTFAEFLKTKMRSFDMVQKSIAQKLISDVMFMAGTKQLQLGTVVLNPQMTVPQFIMTNAIGTNAIGTNAIGTNAIGTNAIGSNMPRPMAPVNQAPQIIQTQFGQRQGLPLVRYPVNNGAGAAKKTGSFSAYVDDDSDDESPLAKRSK